MWDIVIAVCCVAISASLVPQVVDGYARKSCGVVLGTSVPYLLCVGTMIIAYAFLGLVFTATITGLTSLLWLALVVERLVYDH